MKNDLISRRAAIRWVKTECNPYGKPTLDYESGKKVIEHLEAMPSAQSDHSGDVNGKVDLIDRQAAIDALTHKWDGMVTSVFDVVNSLPSAQQERKKGEWIPVSERLPEDYTDVLVWFEYFRYGDYNCLYQTYGIGDYIANYGWMINHETGWHKLRVIAWMPLPEPWKGEQK